jgi:hypothetical protein
VGKGAWDSVGMVQISVDEPLDSQRREQRVIVVGMLYLSCTNVLVRSGAIEHSSLSMQWEDVERLTGAVAHTKFPR